MADNKPKDLNKPSPKPAAAGGGAIKVRAKLKGYYGEAIKNPGDVFLLKPYEAQKREKDKETGELIDQFDDATGEPVMETISAQAQFSRGWMVKVTDDRPKASQAKAHAEDDKPTGDKDAI